MNYQNQHEALIAAAQIVKELPPGTTFGIEVTDEDWEDASVLNIYAKSHAEQMNLLRELNLTQLDSTDVGNSFVSYRVGPLLVSIMEPEEDENE